MLWGLAFAWNTDGEPMEKVGIPDVPIKAVKAYWIDKVPLFTRNPGY
jgi:hypothetical protein